MGEGEIRDGIFSVINNKCTFVIKDSKNKREIYRPLPILMYFKV